jgi:DNA-binding NarL/FixJ family response regulator
MSEQVEQKYRVLLVEDDENISNAIKGGLEIRNYEVTVIKNGTIALNAIDKMNRDDYHLVLLDLMLPGANGWEILIKLRSNKNTAHLPVIMITCVDDESCETRALYDGADDYITKPFSMKVLTARIENCINKKKTTAAIDFDLYFTDGNFEELSKREKTILDYIVKGYSNKEIAKLAYISEITVSNHIHNIFQKLKVNSRTQAAIVALKYKIV